MHQIIARWTVPGAADDVLNIFNFRDDGNVQPQRAALAAFLVEYMANVGTGVSVEIEQQGRIISESTGETTGFWSDSTPIVLPQTGPGGQAVGNASSVLVRWITDNVTNGRRVQGRTFLPGLSTIALVNGGVAANVRQALTDAAAELIAEDVGFGVWHRPAGEGLGSLSVATAANVWDEFGVVRNRRG